MGVMVEEDKKFYVYQLRVEDEALPLYIGKGQGNRCYQHTIPSNLKGRSHKIHAIKKALREGKKVLIEFLETNLTEQDAFTYEIFFISIYGRRINGGCLTNATNGGEGNSGYIPSEETRLKLSKAHKGKPQDKNFVEKRASALRGKKRTLEARQKMSAAKKGKPISEAARESRRNSLACKGENKPNAKLTESTVLEIYQLLRQGLSQQKIADIYGVERTTIKNVKLGTSWNHLYHNYLENPCQTSC